jgi:hypothetical protein
MEPMAGHMGMMHTAMGHGPATVTPGCCDIWLKPLTQWVKA